jgi:hypothetical protein
MEKGHAEKVHSTYENHNENIGKKTTQYVKTTLSKTANQVKMGCGPMEEWPSGGRAQQDQCQTPAFDKYEKRIANFVNENQFTP